MSEAISLYENYLKENPQDTEAMLCLAGIYGKAGKLQQEEDMCQKAIVINPNYPDLYVNLGNAE